MRLYEIAKASLDNDIEQQLKDTAAGIDTARNTPDLPDGVPPPDEEDPDSTDPDMKPVDPAMFAAFKNLPYVTKYNFAEDDKTHPMRIMTMDLDQLHNLENLVRTKTQMAATSGIVPGQFDSSPMEFYQDLLSFVDKVIAYRKQHDERNTPARASPDVLQQTTPKNAGLGQPRDAAGNFE